MVVFNGTQGGVVDAGQQQQESALEAWMGCSRQCAMLAVMWCLWVGQRTVCKVAFPGEPYPYSTSGQCKRFLNSSHRVVYSVLHTGYLRCGVC